MQLRMGHIGTVQVSGEHACLPLRYKARPQSTVFIPAREWSTKPEASFFCVLRQSLCSPLPLLQLVTVILLSTYYFLIVLMDYQCSGGCSSPFFDEDSLRELGFEINFPVAYTNSQPSTEHVQHEQSLHIGQLPFGEPQDHAKV
jgi:hypothetical protein